MACKGRPSRSAASPAADRPRRQFFRISENFRGGPGFSVWDFPLRGRGATRLSPNEEVPVMEKQIMQGTDFFSSGEVATAVGLSRWKFLYRVERGDLPGPTHTVAGRRLFSAEDVEQIKQAMKAREAKERG
jgi:hypothetical protein